MDKSLVCHLVAVVDRYFDYEARRGIFILDNAARFSLSCNLTTKGSLGSLTG